MPTAEWKCKICRAFRNEKKEIVRDHIVKEHKKTLSDALLYIIPIGAVVSSTPVRHRDVDDTPSRRSEESSPSSIDFGGGSFGGGGGFGGGDFGGGGAGGDF